MKIMSIITDTNTINFSLLEDDNIIAKGRVERVSLEDSCFYISYKDDKLKISSSINDYSTATKLILDKLLDLNIINNIIDIKAISFKIIFGGTKHTTSVIIDDQVIEDISNYISSFLIYDDNIIEIIKSFKAILPNTLLVGVFDTAFNSTMEPISYLYPLPIKWYHEYGVRKYGFRGISHSYTTDTISKRLGRENFKLISCYLGREISIAGIKNMQVVDNSAGFSPLDGAFMSCKSGSIDPTIIPFIMEKEGKNAGEVIDELNTKSGLIGLSNFTSNMHELLIECDKENRQAIIAKNKFAREIACYISKEITILGGVDVIAFTGESDYNITLIRREICEYLSIFGVKIDLDLNQTNNKFISINSKESKIRVYVVPNNEELTLVKEALNIIKDRK